MSALHTINQNCVYDFFVNKPTDVHNWRTKMFQILKQFFYHKNQMHEVSLDEDPDTGDIILDLTAVVNQLDWREGDELDVQVQGDCIVIKNLTKHPELF